MTFTKAGLPPDYKQKERARTRARQHADSFRKPELQRRDKEVVEERTPAQGDKSFDIMRRGGKNSPYNEDGTKRLVELN